MADLRSKLDWQLQDKEWIWTMNLTIHIFDNLFCSNSSPILELSVKFASQICHENFNKPLDGAYLADFVIDIILEDMFMILSRDLIPSLQMFAAPLHTNQ